MVKRNNDGTLKVIAQLPDPDWIHEGTPEVRQAIRKAQLEVDRDLTEAEVEAIRKQFTE